MSSAGGRGFGIDRAGLTKADALAAAVTFAAAVGGFTIDGTAGTGRRLRVTMGGVGWIFARGCSVVGAKRFEMPFGNDNLDRGGSDGGGSKPPGAVDATDDRPERSMPGSVG